MRNTRAKRSKLRRLFGEETLLKILDTNGKIVETKNGCFGFGFYNHQGEFVNYPIKKRLPLTVIQDVSSNIGYHYINKMDSIQLRIQKISVWENNICYPLSELKKSIQDNNPRGIKNGYTA